MAIYKEARTPMSGKKKLDHIELKEGENGGHVVRHVFAPNGMEYHKPKEYVFGADEGADLASHLQKHMGVGVKPASDGDGA